MRWVFDALSPDDRGLLTDTRYADRAAVPSLLRNEGGRPVFSVRDFQDDPLDWVHGSKCGDPADVNAALTRLYAAMYGSGSHGIKWRRGLLVVIDNTAYFHGRTAGAPADGGQIRHLKRLRLSAPTAVA